jgi:hypothetical protein
MYRLGRAEGSEPLKISYLPNSFDLGDKYLDAT